LHFPEESVNWKTCTPNNTVGVGGKERAFERGGGHFEEIEKKVGVAKWGGAPPHPNGVAGVGCRRMRREGQWENGLKYHTSCRKRTYLREGEDGFSTCSNGSEEQGGEEVGRKWTNDGMHLKTADGEGHPLERMPLIAEKIGTRKSFSITFAGLESLKGFGTGGK